MRIGRKLIAIVTLLLFTSLASANDLPSEATQSPNAPYRLFNTKNIYTLLKLDTRDGRIWQLQWGHKAHRFVAPINSIALTSGDKAGRFTLCPTTNIYTFVLLDQETGDAWHVQWSETADTRFAVHIDGP
jgi:hypothetical protein